MQKMEFILINMKAGQKLKTVTFDEDIRSNSLPQTHLCPDAH